MVIAVIYQKMGNTQKCITQNSALPIIGGIFIHLILGVVYTWGNIEPYIASCMRTQKGLEHIQHKDLTWVLSASTSGQAVGMLIGGLFEARTNPCITAIVGGLCLGGGVFLSSFLLHTRIGFILSYGLLFGVGAGFCYTAPISCALRWLPGKQGLVSGIITAGFGASALIFNQIQTHFVNPFNMSPIIVNEQPYFDDPGILYRLPYLIFYLSFIYTGCVCIGALFLQNPTIPHIDYIHESTLFNSNNKIDNEKPQVSPILFNETKEIDETLQSHKISEVHQSDKEIHTELSVILPLKSEVSLREAFQSSRFFFLFSAFLCNGITLAFVASNWKVGPGASQYDDAFLSIVGSIASIANSMGRIAWGYLGDICNVRISLILLSGVWIIALLSWPLCAKFGEIIFCIIICSNFFCLGGNFAIFPAATVTAFGRVKLGIIYGALFFSQFIAGNTFAIISQLLTDRIGIYGLCFLFTLFVCTTFFNVLIFGKNMTHRWNPKEQKTEL